jgi:hypothetical protein
MNPEDSMNVQAKVALDKQKHPERFCKVDRCLWRVLVFPRPGIDAVAETRVRIPAPGCDGGYCPRHQPDGLAAIRRAARMTGSSFISALRKCGVL